MNNSLNSRAPPARTRFWTSKHSLSFRKSITRDKKYGLPVSNHVLELSDSIDIAATDMSTTSFTDTSMLQDRKPFIVPGLSDRIELTTSQLPVFGRQSQGEDQQTEDTNLLPHYRNNHNNHRIFRFWTSERSQKNNHRFFRFWTS